MIKRFSQQKYDDSKRQESLDKKQGEEEESRRAQADKIIIIKIIIIIITFVIIIINKLLLTRYERSIIYLYRILCYVYICVYEYVRTVPLYIIFIGSMQYILK